jgi:molybdenum cofactor biosynthesis enzyme MoaA
MELLARLILIVQLALVLMKNVNLAMMQHLDNTAMALPAQLTLIVQHQLVTMEYVSYVVHLSNVEALLAQQTLTVHLILAFKHYVQLVITV